MSTNPRYSPRQTIQRKIGGNMADCEPFVFEPTKIEIELPTIELELPDIEFEPSEIEFDFM